MEIHTSCQRYFRYLPCFWLQGLSRHEAGLPAATGRHARHARHARGRGPWPRVVSPRGNACATAGLWLPHGTGAPGRWNREFHEEPVGWLLEYLIELYTIMLCYFLSVSTIVDYHRLLLNTVFHLHWHIQPNVMSCNSMWWDAIWCMHAWTYCMFYHLGPKYMLFCAKPQDTTWKNILVGVLLYTFHSNRKVGNIGSTIQSCNPSRRWRKPFVGTSNSRLYTTGMTWYDQTGRSLADF